MLLRILTTVLIGSDLDFSLIINVLGIVGLALVFRKFGMPVWRALVPAYRDYSLGECVNMEAEGMARMIAESFVIIGNVALLFFTEDSSWWLIIDTLELTAVIISLVYKFRMCRNLCNAFGIKPGYAVLMLVFDSIVFIVLGIGKKYQPAWKYNDTKMDTAQYFSGTKAKVLEDGLTVNLNKRTAREFMKTKVLLRDVHMQINPGRMVLLLGGSGAGKTTLLDAIIGYEKADAEIMLNGENVYANYSKMQYEVGYVPQLDLMRGQDTVFHTLMDAAALRLPTSFSRSERRERVEAVMQLFGLTPARDTMVDKMSGGQRKRLSIAMEFIPNPSLFILDEPDSGLDGVMARELMQQLRYIADQGKIVMVITHTPDRVIDLFDDVIVLAKDSSRTGRLSYFGPITEARKFFGEESMEGIVKCINGKDVGGKGLADEFVKKYAEVQNG